MFNTIASLGTKQIIGIIAAAVLIIGIGAGVYLVQRQQTLKSRATVVPPPGNFVTAFEIREGTAGGSLVNCNPNASPYPECTTRTLDINVRVATTEPLLP